MGTYTSGVRTPFSLLGWPAEVRNATYEALAATVAIPDKPPHVLNPVWPPCEHAISHTNPQLGKEYQPIAHTEMVLSADFSYRAGEENACC